MEVLKASKRSGKGSHVCKHLRRRDQVPGIIYGHGEQNVPVSMDKHEMLVALLHGERVLELDLEGHIQNVLVKDIQYDALGKEILHVDLARVNLDERIEVTVAIVLRGTPTAEGGVISQNLADVTIECTVRSIPEEIRVNIANMQLDDVIRVKDLVLPEGATLANDPEAIVCSLSEVAEEVAATEGEAGGAEPEVIGAKKEEEAEGEAEAKPGKEKKEK